MKKVLGFVLGVVLAASPVVWAQLTSGTIYGTVKDPQGAVIVGAKVTVVDQARRTSVETVSSADGTFAVPSLQAGTYTVTVEMAGFKKYEKKDVILRVNDRLQLGDLSLELGATAETVTVQAEIAMLQTQSAERSGIITGTQTVNLALNGRNYLDLIKTVPGVVSDFNGQVAGPGGIGAIYVNGQRGNQNNLTLDGATNMDTGSNGTQHTSLNIDAVAEFRVLTNGQQAEFGRSAGAAINIVTKGGTQDFHGTGYWFHRHEGLNANNWRNNRDGLPRRYYRYNYQGYNVGGPVYVPGKFNKDKDKLFFFFGQEFQRQLVPNTTRFVTVPTPDQRNGDFSNTRDAAGVLQTIVDPLNNRQPFPGGRIPASRFSADGQKILNFYPLPNVSGQPSYNFQSQESSSYPRRQEIYRIDWNINQKWRAFFRVINDKDEQFMPYGQWSADYNIPFGKMRFAQPGHSAIANLTTVLNPTLTNEFIFGPSRNRLTIDPTSDAFSRAKLGLTFRPLYSGDPLGLVPNFRFEGVPNGPFTGFNGTPFRNVNNTFDFSDNLSKVFTSHHVKIGFYIQRSRKDQTAFTPANANIWFNRDAQNPGDTNWDFANALVGNFQRYQQANVILNGLYRYTNVEWYIQDNWKIRPGLTLDYGMRFYLIQPQYDAALQTSSFNPEFYRGADAVKLMERRVNPATGTVQAYNPVAGTFHPAALIGSLAPNVGSRANGMARAGLNKYPRGLIDSRGIHYAPRFGLAWDPWRTGKMVFRMGGGVFFDRFQGNPVFDQLPNPPSTDVPTVYYGNLTTVAGTAGVFFPPDVRGFARDGKVPSTYNYNAGIQYRLPASFILDVAYAGSVSRHLLNRYDFNEAPFGSAWLPQNQDPTVANPTFDGNTTLPVNFYRPYIGFGRTDITAFGATSNYNSLQVALNRRVARGFNYGLAYTWSRALGTASGDGDRFHPFDARKYLYGPLSFDRTHVFVFNYIYDVPKLAKNSNFLDNPVGRAAFNNWQIAGITSFSSGQYDGIGYGITGVGGAVLNRRITGSETIGPRVVLRGNPNRSKGQRAIDGFIDTGVFAPAQKGSVGLESPLRFVRRPGINNWDLSIYKNFPFAGEMTRYLQLRCEMFNVWNHTQFTDFNRGITFNAAGTQILNLPNSRGGTGGTYGFGAVNGARDPRIIQLAAKIYF
jgi:hypothetical protein